MVKSVLLKPGIKTALVVVGWTTFVFGELLEDPMVAVLLKAIARVLPWTFWWRKLYRWGFNLCEHHSYI